MLTYANKAKRLERSRKNLDRVQRDGDFLLNRLVTCDETRLAHYEPESKQELFSWKHPSSPVTKKFRAQ